MKKEDESEVAVVPDADGIEDPGLKAGNVAPSWALMYAPMAHVSAMRETSVVFAALIGMFALGESFGPRRIIAALMVASGLIIMQLFG